MATDAAKKKEQRLEKLLEKLQSGTDVQARDIKAVLTDEQHQAMEQEWKEQKELRKIEKPDEVARYERLLQEALMREGRAERYATSKRKPRRVYLDERAKLRELRAKSEHAFERARENLEEILTADPSLTIWFDRVVDFAADSDLSLSAVGMPRVITSKSGDNNLLGKAHERFGERKTKREIKLEALERALRDLSHGELTEQEREQAAEQAMKQANTLKALLKKVKG